MKTLSRVALVVVLLVATVGVASADFTGPYIDTWVIVGGANNPGGTTLSVQDSLGQCNDTQITYFQFDASNIATVSSASLVLTAAYNRIGLENSPKLSIYGVTDFDLATGAGAPVTTGLTPLQTIDIPSVIQQYAPITFSGAGLAGYIQTEANGPMPQKVTLALSFSANCSSINSTLAVYSQRTATTQYRPQLTIVGSKKDPTAVAVSTFSADDSKVTWPLYAGLGALALVVAGALAISRRRAAVQ